MFWGRMNELNQLNKCLRPTENSIVHLIGAAGIGKTELVKQYIYMNKNKYSNIVTWHDCEIPDNIQLPLSTLLILEEADFLMPEIVNQILSLNKNINIIIISRQINKLLVTNTDCFCNIVTLNPLNQDEAVAIFKAITKVEINEIMGFVSKTGGNPLLISLVVELINKYNLTSVNELIFKSLILDKNGIVIPENKIETPTIINIKFDVSEVNHQLMEYIAENPDYMHKLAPYQFEEMMAKLFNRLGYTVQLTPRTRDGGKDIYIAQKNDIGTFLFFVECKKYAPNRPVGIDVIRNLYGVMGMENQRATGGIVATTSYFTKDAKEQIITNKLEHRISLHDYNYICTLLKKAYLDN